MGELEKKEFFDRFESVRPDLFFPEDWSAEKRELAIEELRPNRTKTAMLASIPMRCQGSKCPVADTCPLYAKNLHPTGKPCPIELKILIHFMESFMDELKVDSDNMMEVGMVRDLADQEIQYIRSSNRLAKEDFIKEVIVGINERTGEPIINEQLHPAVDFQDRIHKRRRDIRKELLASREARAKVGQGNADASQVMAKYLEQQQKLDRVREDLLRKELGLPELAKDFIDYNEDGDTFTDPV